MNFWRRSARKPRRENIRKTVIREKMKAEKDIMENIEEKKLCSYKRNRRQKFTKKVATCEPERRRRRETI